MGRPIQDTLKRPLAELLLFGALKGRGGTVLIEVEDDRPKLVVRESDAASRVFRNGPLSSCVSAGERAM